MSQSRGTADRDGEGLSPEALQQYLAALAEDRDASVERTEGILSRFFKVAIVMVCLNVVIAGANIAMVLIRPRTVAVATPAPTVPAPPPVAAQPPQPTPPVAPVQTTPAVAVESEPSIQAPVSPTEVQPTVSPKPALAPKPAVAPQPAKKVPLLGPLPTPRPATVGAPMLARRPAKPVGREMMNKPFLSTEEYEADDDGPPLGPPERW